MPCTGAISEEDYQKIINEKRLFLVNDDTIIHLVDTGKIDAVVKAELKDLENEKNVHLLGDLKECIVAGYDRVFEVAKCFRNEGMDSEHLQEFT